MLTNIEGCNYLLNIGCRISTLKYNHWETYVPTSNTKIAKLHVLVWQQNYNVKSTHSLELVSKVIISMRYKSGIHMTLNFEMGNYLFKGDNI